VSPSTTSTPATEHARSVAIIMDGNGRWAERRGLPVAEGHREGTRALRRTVEAAIDLEVQSLAVYAFSTENWTRPADVDEDALAALLYAPELPDPDLLIRTSGELRLSNFLLWQLAYAELVFVDTLWPDFGADDLRGALADYATRRRRYGGR
jgi:undecaprenyl pyrophosphate synthase